MNASRGHSNRRPKAEPELAGRVALVTGAASGIGRAISAALVDAGAVVALLDVDATKATEVAGELLAAQVVEADVADRDQCRHAVDAVVREHGGVDILVNNAGLQLVSPLETFPEDTFEYLVRVMLLGPFYLTRAVLPGMYERGWGRIVNIASIHALVASPNKSAYVAAKHGLLGLTRAAALEAGARGVTVNAVCPAYVRTPLVEGQVDAQARTLGISPDVAVDQVMLAPSALRRLIEPEEVAAYVRFLCSLGAASITGAAQLIDGGWTAR